MIRECISCDDILLVPRYSAIQSRNDCDPGVDVYSLPLIASCMDTVYSPEIDEFLTNKKILVMVHRYFKDYKEQLENSPGFSTDYRFYAVGSIVTDSGKKWIDGLIDVGIKHFVVDMAHGDSMACYETTRYITKRVADAKVIAGNVAVKSGFRRLQEAGAWAIRVGVGSGCFTPNMEVMTSDGLKPICVVEIGDEVYTHTGELKDVMALIKYKTDEIIYKINKKIECTGNHEFYVIHKKYRDIVDETNYMKYAKWIRADELNEDYFMLEIEE